MPPPPPPPPPTRGQRIVRILVNPFYAAKLVFLPSRPDRIEDLTVRKLQIWRTVVGIAVWVWMMITYGMVASAGDAGDAAGERLNQSWYSIMALTVTFPIVVGGFVYATRGPRRRIYLRRALRSFGSVLAIVGGVFTFVVGAAPEFKWFRDLVGAPGKVIGAVVLLWMIGFVLYGMVLALVHVVRTADIHELVPPLLATILVWEMAIVDLATGAYPDVPLLTRVGFILGAPVSVSVLAAWEYRRLHRHHGLTLRGALMR